MENKRRSGEAAEEVALRYLEEKGDRLHEKNWRVKQGETDLILWEGPCLVFVEVRSKKGKSPVSILEAVPMQKRIQVRKLVELYLIYHRSISQSILRIDTLLIH